MIHFVPFSFTTMAGMELLSSCWYPWLHSPAQARHYSAGLKMNYLITFIYIGRCLGFVISTFLLHPNIHVSLQCPSSLTFFTPSFPPSSGLLLAFPTCCTSWALTVLPSATFTARPLTPVLFSPDSSTCIPSTQQLHNICSHCILIEGVCSLSKPSSQLLCI